MNTEYLINILLLMLSAVLVENYIFVQFLGICPFLGVSEKPDTALGMGFAVIFVMTLSSAATWLIYYFILVPFGLEYLETIAFILIIAALVQFIEMFLRKFVPALYGALGIYLPLITTNCAVLGVTVLNIDEGYNFLQSMVNAFGCGMGYLLAMVLFAGVRSRLENIDAPEHFKGLPLTLIAASILSASFVGFTGVVDGLFM